MAKGETISKLYFNLGLDMSQLTADFIAADKTINENMARLNREKNLIKIKAEVDMAGLDAAKDKAKILEIQEKALTQQIDMQRQRISLAEAAYKDFCQRKGETSTAAKNAATALEKERLAMARLEAQLKSVSQQKLPTPQVDNRLLSGYTGLKNSIGDVTGKLAELRSATASTDSAITKSLELLGAAPGPYAKLGVAIGALIVLPPVLEKTMVSLAQTSIHAGEATYQLAQRMGTTTAEAAKLKKIFTLAGKDINTGITAFVRLDKAILNAGESGNATTLMLKHYGVELRNNNGTLKSYAEQLDALAEGYRKAKEEGNQEAFVTQVLGPRGLELSTILSDLERIKELVGETAATGLLDPMAAHEANLQIKAMEMNYGQLKSAISAAFVPVAKEVLPDLNHLFKTGVEIIRDNKGEVKAFTDSLTIGLKTAAIPMQLIVDGIKAVSDGLKNSGITSVLDDINNRQKFLLEKHPVDALLSRTAIFTEAFSHIHEEEYQTWKEAIATEEARKKAAAEAEEARRKESADTKGAMLNDFEAVEKAAKAMEESRKRAAKNFSEARAMQFHREHKENPYENEIYDLKEWRKEQLATEEITAQERLSIEALYTEKLAKINADRAQKAKEANKEITDSIYALTHSDLDTKLYQIGQTANKRLKEGIASPELINQQAELQKIEAIKNANKEMQNYLDGIYKTSLQQRLNHIEQEKQAWIKKGLDEVEATKAAEKQKLDAKRNAALEVLRQQREELEIYNRSGEYGLTQYLRNKNNIGLEEMRIRPEDVEKFQQAYQKAMENLLPNFAPPKEPSPMTFEMNGQKYSLMDNQILDLFMKKEWQQPDTTNDKQQTSQAIENKVEVHVNIENAVTQNNEGMRLLADAVADKISPPILRALGGDSNSYSNW